MKKFKELMVMLGIMLGIMRAPIVGCASESKQGFFWTLFILGLTALLAWDAGMMNLPNKKNGND